MKPPSDAVSHAIHYDRIFDVEIRALSRDLKRRLIGWPIRAAREVHAREGNALAPHTPTARHRCLKGHVLAVLDVEGARQYRIACWCAKRNIHGVGGRLGPECEHVLVIHENKLCLLRGKDSLNSDRHPPYFFACKRGGNQHAPSELITAEGRGLRINGGWGQTAFRSGEFGAASSTVAPHKNPVAPDCDKSRAKPCSWFRPGRRTHTPASRVWIKRPQI